MRSSSYYALLLCCCVFLGGSVLVMGQYPSQFGGCPSFPDAAYNRGRFPSAAEVTSTRGVRRALNQAKAQAEILREDEGTPGMTVGVVYNGEVIMSQGFGYANVSQKSPVTEQTVFRLGSISKVFVVLTMMRLRDMGLLSLDDEVVKHVPEFRWKMPSHWIQNDNSRGITFAQLGSHLAGLPSNNPYQFPLDIDNAAAWRLFANVSLILPTDTMPLYSNLAFECLGNLLKEIYSRHVGQNVSFARMVDELVLQPSGLTQTSAILTPSLAKFVAESYNPDGTPCGLPCTQDWGWSDPAGSFFSSTRDMLAVLNGFLGGSSVWPQPNQKLATAKKRETIIHPSMAREMFLPRYINSDKLSGFSLPFELYYFGDFLIRTKRGDDDGWATEMIMVPELRLGLIVMVNMVEHAAEPAQQLMNTLIPAIDSAIRTLQGDASEPSNPLDYVGRYSNDGSVVDITSTDGSLYFQTNDQLGVQSARLIWNEKSDSFQLEPLAGDQWSCIMTQVEQSMFEWVEFSRDNSGKVVSLNLPAITGYQVTYSRE